MNEMQQLLEDLEKRLAGSENSRHTEVSKEQQQLHLWFVLIRLHEDKCLTGRQPDLI